MYMWVSQTCTNMPWENHLPSSPRLDEVMEGGGSGDESEEEEEEEEEGTGPLVSLSQQLREGCFIPNAEFIHRARREREERRQMGDGGGGGGAPGFMALSTSKKKVPTATGKSRLVREDDNDKSDESGGEDGGRRRMDGGTHDMAAVKQFQVRRLLFICRRGDDLCDPCRCCKDWRRWDRTKTKRRRGGKRSRF